MNRSSFFKPWILTLVSAVMLSACSKNAPTKEMSFEDRIRYEWRKKWEYNRRDTEDRIMRRINAHESPEELKRVVVTINMSDQRDRQLKPVYMEEIDRMAPDGNMRRLTVVWSEIWDSIILDTEFASKPLYHDCEKWHKWIERNISEKDRKELISNPELLKNNVPMKMRDGIRDVTVLWHFFAGPYYKVDSYNKNIIPIQIGVVIKEDGHLIDIGGGWLVDIAELSTPIRSMGKPSFLLDIDQIDEFVRWALDTKKEYYKALDHALAIRKALDNSR